MTVVNTKLYANTFSRFLTIALAALALAACGGEETRRTAGDSPSPSNPSGSTPPAPSNSAPTISGTPPTSAQVDQQYSFRPSASDADSDSLSFSVSNKPSWATFNTSTGRLSGTPAASDVRGYDNIVISVSDGEDSASLPAFSIEVVQVSNGSATVSWTPPTQNTDGTTLTNLSGYRILYGASSNNLNRSAQAGAGVSTHVIEDLSQGTWYFVVKAHTSTGAESDASNMASKTIS
jgi:hypothetical protein